MSSAVDTVNQILSVPVRLLAGAFSSSPVIALSIISLISGVVLLFLYGKVSNQKAIKRTKRKISSYMLEAVLFRHDIKTCLSAQGKMFGQAFVYFALAVPPLLILMVPCILLLAQLNLFFGARPYSIGDSGVLKLSMSDSALMTKVSAESSGEIKLTPPLRVGADNSIYWRVDPIKEGRGKVEIKVAGESTSFPVFVATSGPELPTLSSTSPLSKLLYPGGPPLLSQIKEISLSYPSVEYKLFGIQMHWILLFFILSLASGLVAAKFLKIEI